MANKKRQHYVPQFYLRGFSNKPSGKQIGIYHLPTDKYIGTGAIKTQAYEDNFYGSADLEDFLGTVEGRASEIIANIVKHEALPGRLSEDHRTLSLFVLSQRLRTLHAADALEELADKSAKNLLSHDPRLCDDLDKFRLRIKDPAAVGVGKAALSHPLTWDLRYKVFRNRSPQPFVTSDNPVVFYNQFLEHRNPSRNNIGIACKGLEIFFPLNSTYQIVFFDSAVYKVGGRKLRPAFVDVFSEEDVLALNILQAANAHEHLYFNGSLRRKCLDGIIRRSKRFRRPYLARVCEYEGGIDENGHLHTLLITEMAEVRTALKLRSVEITKLAQEYKTGGRLMHLRDPEICELHRQFVAAVEAGEYEVDQFPEFLKANGR